MKFNKLQTSRLTIRRLQPGDAEIMAYYRSMPEVARFQSPYSLERAEKLVQAMQASDPAVPGKWFQFALELSPEEKLIGDIGFLNNDENGKSWIGFTLRPEYWGRGFATEAVRAVLGYYRGIGISTVWASIDPLNASSEKLLKALGFTLVESKPDDLIFSLALQA